MSPAMLASGGATAVDHHARAICQGRAVDISVRPYPSSARSGLVILIHRDDRHPSERLIEYVIDRTDPEEALETGWDIARRVIEAEPD